ncbi:hypothetical protein ACW180_09685 [Limosilactobacillus fermentum]
MNFRRIQWIFLIAFIILDLVLVSTLLWGNENFSTSGKQQSQTQLTLKEMKSNSITYPKLSPNSQTGYYSSGDPGDLSTERGRLKNQTTRTDGNLLTANFVDAVRPIFFPVSPQATKEATEGFAPVLARD